MKLYRHGDVLVSSVDEDAGGERQLLRVALPND